MQDETLDALLSQIQKIQDYILTSPLSRDAKLQLVKDTQNMALKVMAEMIPNESKPEVKRGR